MTSTISTMIHQELVNRIELGDPPESFSLQHLSQLYQVSITPIRQALQSLVDEEYLIKHTSGRFTLNDQRNHLREKKGNPENFTPRFNVPDDQSWVRELQVKIIRQSILGETIFLREEATAKQYGVGRTIIRQVFNRFAGAGLLKHLPRRGWQIRKFNDSDMRHYLKARLAMELTALEQSRNRLDQEILQQMLLGNQSETSNSSLDNALLDNNLHAYLIECSENPYIKDFFQRHGFYYSVLFEIAAPETQVVQEMAGQHRNILKALLAKDWAAAKAALSEHIQAQEPIMQKFLEKVAHLPDSESEE